MARIPEGGNLGVFDGTGLKDIRSHRSVTISDLIVRNITEPETLRVSTSPLYIQQMGVEGGRETMVIIDWPITGQGLTQLHTENAPNKSRGRDVADVLKDHLDLDKDPRRKQRHLNMPGFEHYNGHRLFFQRHMDQDKDRVGGDIFSGEIPAIYAFLRWRTSGIDVPVRTWIYDGEGTPESEAWAAQYKADFAQFKRINSENVDRNVNNVTGASVLAYISPEYWATIEKKFKEQSHGYNKKKPIPDIGEFSMKMTPNSAAALPLYYMDELIVASQFPPAVEAFMASQGK